MRHLSPKQVLQARHYHAAGWSVAELARLLGHTRDTISRVVNGHTHARVFAPVGYVVPQLPSRPPPKPRVPWTLQLGVWAGWCAVRFAGRSQRASTRAPPAREGKVR